MAQPGDTVCITQGKQQETGILMPSSDASALLLKLDSGYNIGFEKKKVTLKLIKKAKNLSKKSPALTSTKGLPTIAILHTGGTIASRVDYRTGGVTAAFSPTDLLSLFPELKQLANLESELVAQMWSDDLRFAHFTLLASHIQKWVKKGVQGIVVGMGTDNLAVASAALAFMVKKSPVPIIFVGAQRSSDRGSSDAAVNLLSAVQFIVQTDFGGVALCMHASSSDTTCNILSPTKTIKLHTSRRDAFQSVNTQPIARFDDGKVVYVQDDYSKKTEEFVIRSKMAEKVGLLKIHVNMAVEQFLLFDGYDGLIIEGTGLGHIPGQVPNDAAKVHKKFYPALKKIIANGCMVVMTSQCIFGGVNMQVYDKGRDLLELGIISGQDMLANTALVKLSWLLGNYPRKEVASLMTTNMRGEINNTLRYQEKFIEVKP